MPYMSARYAPPDATLDAMGAAAAGGSPARRVIATDDKGVEWQLREDSQVGDWLRFIEAGGTVLAADEPEPEEPEEDDAA